MYLTPFSQGKKASQRVNSHSWVRKSESVSASNTNSSSDRKPALPPTHFNWQLARDDGCQSYEMSGYPRPPEGAPHLKDRVNVTAAPRQLEEPSIQAITES